MALDLATSDLLSELAKAGGKRIHEGTPAELRAMSAGMAELWGDGPSMPRAEDYVIGTEGGFKARVLVPDNAPRGAIIYYHGGGWVTGDLDGFDTLGRRLAARTGCTVVLVDYRLAPEHRYPTAADDAYAALEWVAGNLEAIAGGEVPIIVAGDSAGGNLAAVTCLRARDRRGPAIAMQVLVYPVTDADTGNASYLAEENQLMLDREAMIWFWDHYLPARERRAEPDASPLRAANLGGLPAALVLTAEYDVLRDEGEAYAARLTKAGVKVELQRYEGQMHGFFTLLMLPGSEAALSHVAAAVEERLAAEPA